MTNELIVVLEADVSELEALLAEARAELLAAEADLAEEQAAVNAFRMHGRLKLAAWLDRLLDLETEKQMLLTRLELLAQAQELGLSLDESDEFWQQTEPEVTWETGEDDLLLPTDTPRDRAAEKRMYRELARRFHPDLGNTSVEVAYRTEMMAAVNQAYAAEDIDALYALAGELDPETAAALAAVGDRRVRQLQRQILRLRQRIGRAKRRLTALRTENTARLWRKAQLLDQGSVDWWELVRREIEGAIERREGENEGLKTAVAAAEVGLVG